jgi:hypothetical protein
LSTDRNHFRADAGLDLNAAAADRLNSDTIANVTDSKPF